MTSQSKSNVLKKLAQFPSWGLGPQIFVRTSSTADQVQCGPRVPDQHPDVAPRVAVHLLLDVVDQNPDKMKERAVIDVGIVFVVAV